MKCIFASIFALAFFFPTPLIGGEEEEWERMDTAKKVKQGLATQEIRGGLPSEKMLDLCIPAYKRSIGRFTMYEFEFLPGYYGLTIIAKDGLLKSAYEWSCTHDRTYFDEMTPDDVKAYKILCEKHMDVPFERCIGRRGWERPRMRSAESATQN